MKRTVKLKSFSSIKINIKNDLLMHKTLYIFSKRLSIKMQETQIDDYKI